jgi:hypothetical protein
MSDESVLTCQGCGASIYPEHVQRGRAKYQGGKLLCAVCYKESQPTPEAETVALVEPSAVTTRPAPKAAPTGQGTLASSASAPDEGSLRRPLFPDSQQATRCRTFHAKLNEGSIAFLNNQINQWCDSNENVTIKFCTSTIGVFEGKHADPHLILTVFY